MKITNASTLKLVLLTLSITVILSSNDKKFLESEGSNNNYGAKAVEAVNSGLAKTQNKDIILTNDPNFKTPQLVVQLGIRDPINPGPAVSADEIPAGDTYYYYDGSTGVKHTASFCQQFITKPQACVNQGSCGWCMGEGTCINGTAQGPVNNKDCLRGKYVFEAPDKDWNPVTIPNTVLHRTNVMGAQLTTIVQQRSN